MAADLLRTAIVIAAFIFAGQSVWYYTHTKYRSGKIILLALSLLSLGNIVAVVAHLGDPFNWGLVLTLLGYIFGVYALVLWRRERDI